MQCNIDQRGRRVRLIMGLGLALAAVPLFVWWAPGRGPTAWVVSGCVLLAGLFGVFEAWHGWCALRALRIKVPW
jgi:hypothetical protein